MQEFDALQKVLASLAANRASTEVGQLREVQHALEILSGLDLRAPQRLKILELFILRVRRFQDLLTSDLLAATLPLPTTTRQQADLLIHTFGLLAQGLIAVVATAAGSLQKYQRNPAHVLWQAMQCWHTQLQTSALIGTTPPGDLWRHVFGALQSDDSEETNFRLGNELGRMLALSVAQTESHTPREISLLIDYLQSFAPPIAWQGTEEGPSKQTAYWLAPTSGQPPNAVARRRPLARDSDIVYFDCTALARQARDHLDQLNQGTPPATVGLPTALAAEDYRHVLACAASRWAEPGKRQHGRRASNYRVEVCAHSGALWRLLSADSLAVAMDHPQTTSNWLVINEGPEGYAMLHVTGPCPGLRAGTVLGMRHAETDAWHLCLVRWAKSDNPEHVELGLELLAPAARAVRLASRGSATPVPALLLPALPTLRRGETLLTARGQLNPGAFTLLAEDLSGIRLFDCATGNLTLRTSSIEVFEFTRESQPDIA